jgi:hypothetical protein
VKQVGSRAWRQRPRWRLRRAEPCGPPGVITFPVLWGAGYAILVGISPPHLDQASRRGGQSREERNDMRALLGLLTGGLIVAVSACATMPSPPPSVDVSGAWVGKWSAFQGAGGGDLRCTFLQDRATLHGELDIRNPTVNRTYVSGRVSGNEITLLAPEEGRLVVNGDEMTGTVQGIVRGRIQLRRESPQLPPSPQSP